VTLIDILDRAWRKPFKTKSDYARFHADMIAMAASDGLITTRLATGLYSRIWLITPKGLSYLYALEGKNHD
jgi:hypothetical protein